MDYTTPDDTRPARHMTATEVSEALDRLVPDALALLEVTFRQTQTRSPSRAVLDSAWRLIDRALAAEPVQDVVPSEVRELATVLALVSGD